MIGTGKLAVTSAARPIWAPEGISGEPKETSVEPKEVSGGLMGASCEPEIIFAPPKETSGGTEASFGGPERACGDRMITRAAANMTIGFPVTRRASPSGVATIRNRRAVRSPFSLSRVHAAMPRAAVPALLGQLMGVGLSAPMCEAQSVVCTNEGPPTLLVTASSMGRFFSNQTNPMLSQFSQHYRDFCGSGPLPPMVTPTIAWDNTLDGLPGPIQTVFTLGLNRWADGHSAFSSHIASGTGIVSSVPATMEVTNVCEFATIPTCCVLVVLAVDVHIVLPAGMSASFNLVHAGGLVSGGPGYCPLQAQQSFVGPIDTVVNILMFCTSMQERRVRIGAVDQMTLRLTGGDGVSAGSITLGNASMGSMTAPSISAQPEPAIACPGGSASFAVGADADESIYQWQIQSPPFATTEWRMLTTDPAPMECGGLASATTPDSPQTLVHISPCAGVAQYKVRCTIVNAAGSVTSEEVTYTICPADINCSGTLTVQDIFDFLAFYFASDLRADFNSSGTLSVQDIFDFLAAYFAGCN